MPKKMDKSSAATSSEATFTPDKPTDWMNMVGKGGGKVKGRGTSLPKATNRGSTMPVRRSGTSLPARGTSLPARGMRGAGGTSLPARQQSSESGTTMPARRGTSLPQR